MVKIRLREGREVIEMEDDRRQVLDKLNSKYNYQLLVSKLHEKEDVLKYPDLITRLTVEDKHKLSEYLIKRFD